MIRFLTIAACIYVFNNLEAAKHIFDCIISAITYINSAMFTKPITQIYYTNAVVLKTKEFKIMFSWFKKICMRMCFVGMDLLVMFCLHVAKAYG